MTEILSYPNTVPMIAEVSHLNLVDVSHLNLANYDFLLGCWKSSVFQELFYLASLLEML
jgi:hypothetical protein